MPDPTSSPDPAALRDALRAHVTDLLGEDDPDFVAELAATFCDSASALVATARTAAAAGDTAALRSAAHQMRGSALNVGLADLAEAWTRVEHGQDASPEAALAATERAVEAMAC